MRTLKASSLATSVIELMISTSGNALAARIRWKALSRLRQLLVKLGDPLVKYNISGRDILLPLSHELPIYRREYPAYSENVGRIAYLLTSKYSDLKAIDVGANVGDTAAILHRFVQIPILCIEGEPRFLELLYANSSSMVPAPELETCFVGPTDRTLTTTSCGGTARLSPAEDVTAPPVLTKSFETILSNHPQFESAHLLKIDTDGMDLVVLASALGWLRRQKPVLFFEYDPDLQNYHSENGLLMLASLRDIGYCRVLVYENNGDYMFSTDLGNERLLSEIHYFFSGRNSLRYCDLCIFHREDEDIAEKVRSEELAYFGKARNLKGVK